MGKQRNKNKSDGTRLPSVNLIDWEEHVRGLVHLGILAPTALSNSNYNPSMNRDRTKQPDKSRYKPQRTGRAHE
jgi:hypothetical protein